LCAQQILSLDSDAIAKGRIKPRQLDAALLIGNEQSPANAAILSAEERISAPAP
jgi:hypothetical protein